MHEELTYNPLQEATAKWVDEDCNLVVLAPTSSGKTIVAEQFLFTTIQQGYKGVYLSPLKALTEEKKRDWETQPYSMLVVTGDYAKPHTFKQELILMTTEALDSKTRGSKSWLEKVGCIVVDEAHLLGTSGRGDALEIGLIRFSMLNQDAKLVLLSATIPNAAALGKWLTTLNGKRTEVIETDYRPVEQEYHFVVSGNKEWEVDNETLQTVRMCQRTYPGKQILIFVQTIVKGKRLAEKLGCPFHYSKLSKDKRAALEEAYSKKQITKMVSTSTLAFGINLPADIVIVAGANRGPEKVDPWDLAQMAGRAGRFGLSERGYVFFVLKEMYHDYFYDELMCLHDVESVIDERLHFHLVSFIYREKMQKQNIVEFLSKSFGSSIGLEESLSLLKKYEIVQDKGGVLEVNNVGRAASLMYIDPIDLHYLKQNLQDKPTKPADVAKAFSNLPLYDVPASVPPDLNGDFLLDLGVGTKTINATCLYMWLSGIELSGTAAVMVPRLTRDLQRWLSALNIAGLPKTYVKLLDAMFSYGVPDDMSELVSIYGLGRKKALALFEHNILTLEQAMAQPVLTKNLVGKSVFQKIESKFRDPEAIILNF
jgi:helicase